MPNGHGCVFLVQLSYYNQLRTINPEKGLHIHNGGRPKLNIFLGRFDLDLIKLDLT